MTGPKPDRIIRTYAQAMQLIAMPLEAKIVFSQKRIREWYEAWDGEVSVSFSGGKDSTVLLHLVRNLYPEVPGVFFDTGLEYPEIVEFVKTVPNIEWVKPKLTFLQVIQKHGFPMVSKKIAAYIREARSGYAKKGSKSRTYQTRMTGINAKGKKTPQGMVSLKWQYLVHGDIPISDRCCYELKKNPARDYELRTGKRPFIGMTAPGTRQRMETWTQNGCNAFHSKRPTSNPLMPWTEEDIWGYLRGNNPEGKPVPYSRIYDMGYDRTGCMFCLFGLHMESSPNRFERMKKTHPRLWEYCIKTLGIGKAAEAMGCSYGEQNELTFGGTTDGNPSEELGEVSALQGQETTLDKTLP